MFSRYLCVEVLIGRCKGEIHIISSEFDAGKKLDGLGGIGAILRYKMNY
jgi:stalled ribosome rescue protein Dom34